MSSFALSSADHVLSRPEEAPNINSMVPADLRNKDTDLKIERNPHSAASSSASSVSTADEIEILRWLLGVTAVGHALQLWPAGEMVNIVTLTTSTSF